MNPLNEKMDKESPESKLKWQFAVVLEYLVSWYLAIGLWGLGFGPCTNLFIKIEPSMSKYGEFLLVLALFIIVMYTLTLLTSLWKRLITFAKYSMLILGVVNCILGIALFTIWVNKLNIILEKGTEDVSYMTAAHVSLVIVGGSLIVRSFIAKHHNYCSYLLYFRHRQNTRMCSYDHDKSARE